VLLLRVRVRGRDRGRDGDGARVEARVGGLGLGLGLGFGFGFEGEAVLLEAQLRGPAAGGARLRPRRRVLLSKARLARVSSRPGPRGLLVRGSNAVRHTASVLPRAVSLPGMS
jgi:hypothetical protein